MRTLIRPFLKPFTSAYPLARRMMLIVIVWGILFTLLTAAVQVITDYQQEMSLLNARLQQIWVTEVPSFSNSLWHFDREQIETQLQGLLNLQDISYVEIQVTGENTYSAGQAVATADAFSQSYAIEYIQNGKKYPLGELRVIANISNLQQRVVGRLVSILFTSAIQIFLLAGFILWVVDWLLTRPLNEIVRYTETLDLEHLEQPLVLEPRRLASPDDELELVTLKLNEMRLRLMNDVAEMKHMESALRESERNYREIFNATSEAIFIHEIPHNRILQVNASMLHMYGYATEAEVVGSLVGDLSSNEPPYTQEEAERYLSKAQMEGPQVFEWQARRKNGETFWAEVSLRSSTINGETRILAVVRDISERKHVEEQLVAQNMALIAQGHALEAAESQTRQLNADLEKRVKERTLQLGALNEELETFSYSVAHDLRAPLRRMDSFSQIILEDQSVEANPDVKRWIQRIQDSARNLSQMVDALLAFSRVNREQLKLAPVNLTGLAQTIADDLCQSEPERPVEFMIAPNLTVQADQHLLQVVLENLFGNAWKFSAQCNPARIEVGQVIPAQTGQETEWETNGAPIYYIRDNGAGFDMAYADRLFGPFQRLHSAATFPGTGIGLATVKRIIQRHGGRVWADSAVGAGATFYFTLP